MPRRSLADELYDEEEEELHKEDEPPTERGRSWILLYDFRHVKPHLNFWTNLRRLSAKDGDSRLIQYSCFQSGQRRVARAAEKLARYYGAETELFAAQRC